MCIAVFTWRAHPLHPLLLLLNRDEYHDRPSKPLAWWEGGEIVGGRDEIAGGTWLACSRDGRVAFLTNVREANPLPVGKSRGLLPLCFLESKRSPIEFAEGLMRDADQYNGFNLIIADLCSMAMVYVTNRPKDDGICITDVSPGIHVLSNASLDSPWPKAQRLGDSFKNLLDKYKEGEVPLKEFIPKLMRDTIKDDVHLLPHVYTPEFEYQLSSIFVDVLQTPKGRYGTRSSSALSVKTTGEITFYETYFENEMWKEKSLTIDTNTMGGTLTASDT